MAFLLGYLPPFLSVLCLLHSAIFQSSAYYHYYYLLSVVFVITDQIYGESELSWTNATVILLVCRLGLVALTLISFLFLQIANHMTATQ